MNIRLMQEAKNISKKTIYQNFGKIILIVITAYIPMVLCNVSIASMFPIIQTVDTTNLNYEEIRQLLEANILMQIYVFLISLIFCPITTSARKIIFDMFYKKEVSMSVLFENYASAEKMFKSISIYLLTCFKVIVRSVIFIVAYIGISMLYDIVAQFVPEIFLILPFFTAMLILTYLFFGYICVPLIYENICILNFENRFFSQKYCYSQLKILYKKRTRELANLCLSFLGIFMISFVLGSFTMGITVFVFNIYFALTTTYYTVKYNHQFLPEDIKI